MRFIASLPMYDLPGTRGDWMLLWRHMAGALRRQGIAAPHHLTRPHDLARHWRDRRLLVSQTCGMPYRQGLHSHVALLGAFDFGLPGCPAGYYRSLLISRSDDARPLEALLANGRVVINATDSQSGNGVWDQFVNRACVLPESGSHAASLRALQAGRADLAAIDAQTWRLLRRRPGMTLGLRVLTMSKPTPALPLITAQKALAPLIQHALVRMTVPPQLRSRLGLRGFVPFASRAYLD